jgi:pimeloyl-ACP methyl ester carboxylesterase
MILTVKANGIKTEYIRFGHGEKTLVIIPGLSVKSVLLSEEQIVSAYSPFENEYTVYLFDRRLNMPENYTVYGMANDTAAVMTALGLEDVCLFGVSQGGMIAQCIAIEHPALVSKLVLGSTAARVPGGGIKADAREFLKALYADEFISKLGIAEALSNIEITEDEEKRFRITSKAADGFDVTDRLSRIKCPTLVIGASNDKIIPPAASAELAELTGGELYMYGAPYGHAVYDEAPDYKDRIYSFLMRG